MKKIILASGSPRRKMLLEWAEINFEVMVSDADESFSPGASPEQIAMHIASKKNQAIADQMGRSMDQCILIAADTIVVLDGMIIGKPENRAHAISILQQLSGKTHSVITAVEIRSAEKKEIFSLIAATSVSILLSLLSKSTILLYCLTFCSYSCLAQFSCTAVGFL